MAGRNAVRWKNDEYDKAYRAAEAELDPVKRAALFIRMNDLVCMDNVIIPVVYRPRVAAVSTKLHAPLSGWDNDFWNLRTGTATPVFEKRRGRLSARALVHQPRDGFLHPAAHADHAAERARHQRRAVHYSRVGAGRPVRGAGDQPAVPARGAPDAARQIRPR